MVAHLFLFGAVGQGDGTAGLKLGVLDDVIGSHAVEDELGFVGNPHDVVLHGV